MTEAPRPADLRLGAHVLGMWVRPVSTARALSEQPSARPGASAIALLGIFWSVLLVLLFAGGRRPVAVLLPIDPDVYYMVQALLMLPVLTALWWLHSEIAHRICVAAKGQGSEPGVRAALGFAYAAPMLVHVLAELLAYVAAGGEGLSVVARFGMPVAALWVWALSAVALRVAHRVSIPVAVGASFAGLFVQAAAGALVLR